MTKNEKVVGEWPEHLRDDAQELQPLPEGAQTDFLLVRLRSRSGSSAGLENLAEMIRAAVGTNGEIVVIKQSTNRWTPRNSWPMARGLFDWVMSHVRATLKENQETVDSKKKFRDDRRARRAS